MSSRWGDEAPSYPGIALSRRDHRYGNRQHTNMYGQVRQSDHRHLLVVRDAHLDWGGTRSDLRAGRYREPGESDLHLSWGTDSHWPRYRILGAGAAGRCNP